MAKGQTNFKKRFWKKAIKFGNKRVAAQKWATTTLVARTLYPPLPAEMRLAFKNTTISSYSVESAAMTLQRVSTIESLEALVIFTHLVSQL